MCTKNDPKNPFSETEILREFVALVDDLSSSKFAGEFLNGKLTIQTTTGKWSDGQLLNFDEDYCRSFLSMFRLIYQQNDGISIRAVSRLIEDGNYDKNIGDWISYKRQLLNWQLDENAPFSYGHTYRQVIDTFLWGAYAHRCHNPEARRKFTGWQSEPETFLMRKQCFLLGIKMIFEFAEELSGKVCAILEE
ncbi:MAG: hypothetical protein V4689_11755 [Verrucomicrobiota bacterium]